ncbi:hypothetical protein ACFLYJ_02870 [Candidatus Cloacimonadota bacterium]
MKRNVLIILVIVIVFSALSVVTMIRDSRNQSLSTYATNLECSAQGDLKPETYDNKLLDPVAAENDQLCSNQKEVKLVKK